ncbi:hypothetical protein CTAYLR_006380 [Chrysophaeum taylorii]|uniref:Tyrosinase copper-binding domain-containing protein n=1 Tax=Chrysophaeum taylorii TaxID=2483200 RepID=A0AAD7U6L3_9STRA|nr:hypothetical protein CTAYLR_006380 [Chrysophaeum taylorii]
MAAIARITPSYGTMPSFQKRKRRAHWWIVGSIFGAVGLMIRSRGDLLLGSKTSIVALSSSTSEQHHCDLVCVSASNAYERRLKRPILDGVFPGIVLELFQETEVSASARSCRIEPQKGLAVLNEDACAFVLVASLVGVYRVETDAGPFFLTGKYVRREIRDLCEEDRVRYFGGIHTIYDTSQQEGFAKFGPLFKNIEWFVRIHIHFSSAIECDSFHGGAGFLNAHAAIIMMFEQSLQAVDSRIAGHYWDYTIDYARGSLLWDASVIFSDDWFGYVHTNNSLHVLDRGAFAYTPIIKSLPTLRNKNAYGLMRCPWNVNKTPFLTRWDRAYGFLQDTAALVDCAALAQNLAASNYTFSSLMQRLGGTLHGTLHVNIGGTWNIRQELIDFQDTLMELINYTYISNDGPAHKRLWRWGYNRCPMYCADDVPNTECRCRLNPAINKTSFEILNDTGTIRGSYPSLAGANLSTKTWDLILEQICDQGTEGDSLSDQSTWDPLFWSFHQPQERVMQLVRYYDAIGVINFDSTWGYDKESYGSRAGVSDWSNVKWGSLDMPKVDLDGTCFGHNADDVMVFANILINTNLSTYTNLEFFEMTYPFSDHLKYVYDRITNWTECGDLLAAADSYATDDTVSPSPFDAIF